MMRLLDFEVGLDRPLFLIAGPCVLESEGMAQESERAFRPLGDSKPGWKLIAELARAMGYPIGWKKLKDVRGAMAPEAGAALAAPAASAEQPGAAG